jgi:AraC-like DNA-binding protein
MKAPQLLGIDVAPDLHELTVHGSPNFPCAGYDEDPGKYLVGNIQWHWHEEMEFILAIDGDTLVFSGEKEYLLHPGEAIFVNRNVLHKIKRGQKNVPCRFNTLLWLPEFVSSFPQSIIQQRYIAPLARCQTMAELLLRPGVSWQKEAILHFQAAFEAFTSERYGYEIIVLVELMQMLLILLENLQDRVCDTELVQNKDAVRIKQMLGFIHARYAEPLSVSQIAAASSISESECYRCFRKVLGTSPIDYLLQYRIRAAAGLLSGSDMSVSDICFATGFNSPSYFAKVFRQELLVSPRKYRVTHQSVSSGEKRRS